MMPDNDFYGHRTAMARYCGEASLSPAVFGSIRHGWQPDLGVVGSRRIRAAPFFVWNKREEDQAAERGLPNVIAIGAPFLYGVASLRAGVDTAPPGAGTIVFPLHSGGTGRAVQDHAGLIDQVERNEQGPFTVSVFYQDLDRDDVMAPYRAAGWRMVSFGSRDDPQFMARLILEMQAHHTLVSDTVCSPVWYAAHLGRRVRVLGAPPRLTRRGVTAEVDFTDRWPALHRDGVEGPVAAALAAPELGVDCMRSPDELAELLGWRSWRRYAAPLVRLAVDVRHGNELRRGKPLPRSLRSLRAEG